MIKNIPEFVFSTLILLALATPVMGQGIGLDVSTGQQPPTRISVCPDSVLSDIDVRVTNLGSQTDTIMLSLDWPADLGFIKPTQTLASGETATVKPFWLTIPFNMDPGIYHAKVTAESSLTGGRVDEEIEIEVMRCHSVEVSTEDSQGRSCRETQEPVVYDIMITNQGKFSESYDLSASVEWAEFSRSRVSMSSGNSESVSLVLSPPSGISAGKHTVFITARSIDSYATATSSVEIEAVDCLDYSITLDPASMDTCLGEIVEFELTISNLGDDEDAYGIDLPDWVFSEKSRTELGSGESETIALTAIPDRMGIQRFDVTVTSERDSSADPKSEEGLVDVEECRGVAVIAAPTDVTVCQGESRKVSISIKNTGSVEGSFSLDSSFGILDQDSVTLGPGESTSANLDVDTADLPIGTVVIDISASDGEISDSASVDFEVEECFSATIEIQPDDVVVCPGARIPYIMVVENTGKESDTYTLDFADESVELTLNSGESDTMSYDFAIPYVQEGRYLFTVELTSEGGISELVTSEITLKASESCYGVELVDSPGTVDVGRATTVEITVRNTGEESDNFRISMTKGPEWAFLQPEEIHVGARSDETVYLYLSPGFGTPEGSLTVSVKAESDQVSDEIDILVTVPETSGETPDVPEPTEPEEPAENVTEPEEPVENVTNGEPVDNVTEPAENVTEPDEEGNVSINVTHPTEEDGQPITGGAVEERPFWKTAAVAIIALIIVIILVLRFVLLFKK
jgi:uncharacterized membrane protein